MRLIGPDPLTRAELDQDLPRVITLIRAAPPGRVVVATRSEGAFARAVLGALAAGRQILPLDPASPGPEVAERLQGAGLLLLDGEAASRWTAPPGALVTLVEPVARPTAWQRLVGGRRAPVSSFPGCLSALNPSSAGHLQPGEVLLGTSGTSGRPRLVPWCNTALQAQMKTLAAVLHLGPDAVLLNLLPLWHIDGLVMGLLLAGHVGATLVRPAGRVVGDLPGVLDLVWRHKVSHLVLTPAMLSLLSRAGEDLRELFDNPHFRMFISTAAPLPDGLWRRIEQATDRPVVNVYGLTETGNLLFAGPEAETRRVGTVGRPRDCEIRVVTEAGEAHPPGEAGELQLRGPSVMRAWSDGESPLVQGWYPTGDMAVIDPDGLVRVLGRRKSMLSVGGLKVEPREVEAALLEHPAVRDAHVHGEADPTWGERVVAEVEAEGVDEVALAEHLRARLSEHKLPRRIRLVDAVRRGSTGKPVFRPEDSLHDQVLALAAEVLRAPLWRLSLATRPGEVPGWDSLGHLDLVNALEQHFDLTVSGRELLELRSLADALAIVERRQGRADG